MLERVCALILRAGAREAFVLVLYWRSNFLGQSIDNLQIAPMLVPETSLLPFKYKVPSSDARALACSRFCLSKLAALRTLRVITLTTSQAPGVFFDHCCCAKGFGVVSTAFLLLLHRLLFLNDNNFNFFGKGLLTRALRLSSSRGLKDLLKAANVPERLLHLILESNWSSLCFCLLLLRAQECFLRPYRNLFCNRSKYVYCRSHLYL